MIDLKQEIQDYHIINLKDIAQNEPDIPDNIRNSIILYNKAIESLKNGSEDIAIIELKKATSMNPHFYEAMNLLGICYSYINESVKAAEIFDRVIKAEQNSVKAMKYVSLLNSGNETGTFKSRKGKTHPLGMKRDNTGKVEIKPENRKKAALYNTVRILAGFIAGAVIIYIICLMIYGSAETPKVAADTGKVDAKTNIALQEYKNKYNDLSQNYALLQKDKDEAIQTVDYYKSVLKLYEIQDMVSGKQLENAADMLLLMKTTDFRESDKVKFDNLYKSVMPAAASTVYEDGYKLYNARKFDESLKKLDKVQIYNPAFERTDALLYYMGRCCQQLNDSRNAVAFFQKLIDSYPNSYYAKNAKVKIKALIELP